MSWLVNRWSRLKAALGFVDRRASRAGRWVVGRKASLRGFTSNAWWRWPSRRYFLYIPRGWSIWRRAPLVVLCHGCRQDAQAFASGTRIATLADEIGLIVLMPEQKKEANLYGCWNWFEDWTAEGRGEAAIAAAMIRSVRRWRRADRARVLVAGLSAGAAFAAILAIRHPQLARGAFLHSGLACGAAATPFTALSVMRRGPDTDVAAIARAARSAGGERRVPALILHSLADEVVAARNAHALARQFLAFNGVGVPAGAQSTLPEPQLDVRDTANTVRPIRRREWRVDGQPVVRLVEVGGLAHGWSGGDEAFPFNEPGPPDATAMLGEWLRQIAR